MRHLKSDCAQTFQQTVWHFRIRLVDLINEDYNPLAAVLLPDIRFPPSVDCLAAETAGPFCLIGGRSLSISPPQYAGDHVIQGIELVASRGRVGGRGMRPAGHLRTSEPRHGVEPVEEVLAFGAPIDDLIDERPAEDLGSGASQLGLTQAGFAEQQERALAGQCSLDGRTGMGFEYMPLRSPIAQGRQVEPPIDRRRKLRDDGLAHLETLLGR